MTEETAWSEFACTMVTDNKDSVTLIVLSGETGR